MPNKMGNYDKKDKSRQECQTRTPIACANLRDKEARQGSETRWAKKNEVEMK